MDTYWLASVVLQRGVGALYLVAFVVVLHQFPALLGEKGLLPTPDFVRRVPFARSPSLFHWRYSDGLLRAVAWTGIVLSALVVLGVADRAPLGVSLAVWLILWALYMSVVNVGQRFYGFGWESMLLEAGFFCAFLGPSHMATPPVAVLLLRWMLFRVELGAGLIKIRHDSCWRDLTCLYYHYETQPIPNPWSWHVHHHPKAVHRAGVAFSHLVQIGCPFLFFAPQPFAALAAALAVSQQLWLIVCGNYSWLNWITVVLGFSALGDSVLGISPPPLAAAPGWYLAILTVLAVAAAALSYEPTRNFFSKHQAMNASYNPLHLVNSYGAFGSMTRKRYEVVLEGSMERGGPWREYEFWGKPGDPMRRPPQIGPYHLRLDWLMWFLPFSVTVTRAGPVARGYDVWYLRFVQRLLEADPATLRLLRKDPFDGKPPRYVRARYYLYRYTTPQERRETGAWWVRTLVGDHLPPMRREDMERLMS